MHKILQFIGILLGCLIYTQFSFGDGPVSASSLPGCALAVDSDTGSGESWGRTSGRTYRYSGFIPNNFSALNWQTLFVGLSLDGPIDKADEEMELVRMEGDTAIWKGMTRFPLKNAHSSIPVQTRFTIVLSGTKFIDSPTPTVNVLANSEFAVNILFEARNPVTTDWGPVDTWGPALEIYDALGTPAKKAPAVQLANASFNQGFFFDSMYLATLIVSVN